MESSSTIEAPCYKGGLRKPTGFEMARCQTITLRTFLQCHLPYKSTPRVNLAIFEPRHLYDSRFGKLGIRGKPKAPHKARKER